MSTAAKLVPGDEVVLVRMRRWSSQPPEMKGAGRVTKVGRRYAFADIDGSRSYEFDMTTGYERGDTNGNGYWIVTPARFEMDQRARDAEVYLREHGLDWNRRGGMTDEKLVLVADFVRTMMDNPQSSKEQDR